MKLKNIFSMENSEDEIVVDAGSADLEVEAAEVAEDVVSDSVEVENLTEDTDEAIADIEDLESVEETLEEEVENEDSEGLDVVAAEAIRTNLRGIRRRYGLTTASDESAFARENFSGSVSMRRSNTKEALESIRDTIKNVWDKIVAAIKKAWEAVKAFWNKHISDLGRMKKALEAMRKRVRDIKGEIDTNGEIKAPANMQALFYQGDASNVDATIVGDYVDRHKDATENVSKIAERLTTEVSGVSFANIAVSGTVGIQENAIKTLVDSKGLYGTESKPLVGGFYGELKIDTDGRNTESPKLPRVSIETDTRKSKASKEAEFTPGDKQALGDLIKDMIIVIDETTKLGRDFEAQKKKFDKQMTDVTKEVTKAGRDAVKNTSDKDAKSAAKDNTTIANSYLSFFRSVATMVPSMNTRIASLNVQLGKGVINFCSKSLSYYKQDDN